MVAIGGWGHWKEVLDELLGARGVAIVAVAPAHSGEDISNLLQHPLVASGARQYENHHRMLADLRPEVAVVSTRLDHLTRVARDAVRAGCHLICEKPLALEEGSLHRLWKTVQQQGRHVLAMHTMRNQPAFLAARRVVRTGRLGKLVLINVRKSYKWLVRPQWFGVRAIYGGTIPWIGIHALDVIHFLTGERPRTITAHHANLTRPDFPECEDHAVIIGQLAGGGGAFSASLDYCRPESAPTHGDDWVRIVGSRGVLEANASAGWCRLITAEKPPCDLPLPKPATMFRDFLRALAKGERHEFTTADAFMLTHASLVARKAADRSRWFTIPRQPWHASVPDGFSSAEDGAPSNRPAS
jgi:predicted dehydrogenase